MAIKTFGIEIFVRSQKAVKGAKKAKDAIKSVADESKTTNKALSNLNKFIGGIAFGALAKQTLTIADNYNVLQQRIKTATQATGDFEKVSRDLLDISIKNGTELENNVELFQSLARVAPELEATTDEMLTLTNTVNQLGVIGGASTEAMSNGLLQFTQGLAEGIFRAEEFNSILSNMPEVATRIAKGMGKTTGELRKMVLDGELLSKDVFESLLSQSKEIAEEFEDIAPSIGRSTTSLVNAVSSFIGEMDEGFGLTQSIARQIQNIAEFVADKENFNGMTEAILGAQLGLIKIRSLYDKIFLKVVDIGKRTEFWFRETAINVSAIFIDFGNTLKLEFAHVVDFMAEQLGKFVSLHASVVKELPFVGGKLGGALDSAAESLANTDFASGAQDSFDREQETRQMRLDAIEAERILEQEHYETKMQQSEMLLGQYQKEVIAEAAARVAKNKIKIEEVKDRKKKGKQEEEVDKSDKKKTRKRELVFLRDHMKLINFVDTWEKQSSVQKADFLLQTSKSLFESLANQSRGAFEISKALNLAEAIVGGYVAIQKAWAVGPPANIALAAFTAAKTAVQVRGIKDTKYKGGGSFSPATSGGAPSITTPTTALPALPSLDTSLATPANDDFNPLTSDEPKIIEKRVTLDLQDAVNEIDPEQLYTGTFVRGLMERIQEEQENNVQLNFDEDVA